MAALQHLESLKEARPELSEWCNTLKLQHFLSLPVFQAGDTLIQLYHDFITEFELNINLLKLAHFAVIVSGQYTEKEAAISYLEGVIEKLRNTKEMSIEQPILYIKMQIALFKLEQGNEKECKELIEEGKTTLDSMTDIDPSVYANYNLVSSQYHKQGKGNEPCGPKEDDVHENESLGSEKGQIEVNIHKDGDAEPISSIIKRLRCRNRRTVNAGNDEENGGKGMIQGSGAERGNIDKGEMMTLSEMKMLVKNELNQGRKKLKEKSKLAEIVDNERDKEEGDSGERKEIECEEQIEDDIYSQTQMGKVEGGYETVAKMQLSSIIKVYQRRTKLKEKGKPLSLRQKEKGKEKEKEDSHEEEKEDVEEDGGWQKQIHACVGEKGKESDMGKVEKIDKKINTEKNRKENEHEDTDGQNQVKEKEEENETLAKMQMLAKKKLNKGRMKLKQGKEKEQEDEREKACSQEQVEEELNLEKENDLGEEMVAVGKRSGNELLGQGEEDVGRQKQMDEKEGEEVTLAEMRMSAKKKLNQKRTKLKDKDKHTSVKEKRQYKDDERGKGNEQKDEEEESCSQKEIEEQDGEEENDIEEVAAVKMKRKRERYRIPEENNLLIGSKTREQRHRRKNPKFENLAVLEKREAMTKENEMEEGLSDEEEMTIMNLRKKRARRKPAQLCSFEMMKSPSKTSNSDAETNSCLDIVPVEDFDIYDFSKDRIGRKFQKGQVWAIYDDKDGMPRHYAVIDEVVSVNPFQVQLNWLDIQDTGDKALTSRKKMDVPVACGSFKVSLSVTIKSRKIFSHVADFERAARELYKIYPKKGSVWAMFNKDALDAGGLNIRTGKGSCYDIVVFLTSYSERYGLSMAYLDRVDDFKTVYKRREIGSHAIKFLKGNDFSLFSHHISARKLSGEEVSGLPKDCWELDPSSLPKSLAISWER